MKKIKNDVDSLTEEERLYYDCLSKTQQKRFMVDRYNMLYVIEKRRYDSLTREQQVREHVKAGVESGIKEAKEMFNYLMTPQKPKKERRRKV